MKKLITVAFALAAIGLSFGSLNAADEGWVSLFDGKTLKGWTQRNGTAKYVVKDGTIEGTTNEGSPNSFLCSNKLVNYYYHENCKQLVFSTMPMP